MDRTINAIGGTILVCLVLAVLAWLSDATGATDSLGFKPGGNPTPDCKIIEYTDAKVHYRCADGRDVWEKRNYRP